MATNLNTTTLSGALAINQNVVGFASATNVSAPVGNVKQQVYIIGPGQKRGELATVEAVSGTQITLSRLDKYKAYWPSGAVVVLGPVPVSGNGFAGQLLGGGFQEFDPPGASASNNSSSSNAILFTPWINVETGRQWIWSTVLNCWVPGWGTEGPYAVTAAVASAAGEVTPTGPLFHITGTLAITGFNTPTAFPNFGSFTVIPDGTFTWTTAVNIALAGTAVVNKSITFTWDGTNSLWVPSVIA